MYENSLNFLFKEIEEDFFFKGTFQNTFFLKENQVMICQEMVLTTEMLISLIRYLMLI